jgi:hypothetical protein
VDDHDHIGDPGTKSSIPILEIVLLREDGKAAPLGLGAKSLYGITISIHRANAQAPLGEPERMSTASTCHIESGPG